MKLAIDPCQFRDRPVDEAIRLVASAGFDAIELSPREGLLTHRSDVSPLASEMRKLKLAAEQWHVAVASIFIVQPWASTDDGERTAAIRGMKVAMRAAEELGCRRINTELTGDPHDVAGSRKALVRSLEDLMPEVETLGLEMVLEPHPYDFIESNKEAVDLVASFGSERIGYLFCAPHRFYLGDDVGEMLEYARPHLMHVHLADTFRPSRIILNPPGSNRIHQHLDIGQGEIDWLEMVQALVTMPFDGVLTIAAFAWNDDPIASMARNREAIDRLLEGIPVGRHEASGDGRVLDRNE